MFTWLLEHTLLLLPTWFWFIVAGAGAVLYFFSSFIQAIPFAQAKLAGLSVKYIGFALLLGGIYLSGGAGVTALWQAQVDDMKAKVEKAEQASADANTQIKTVIQEKTKVIRDTQIIVQEKIVKDAAKMDATCIVDPVAIEDLNLAAGGKKK
jgi:hypothetical protein